MRLIERINSTYPLSGMWMCESQLLYYFLKRQITVRYAIKSENNHVGNGKFLFCIDFASGKHLSIPREVEVHWIDHTSSILMGRSPNTTHPYVNMGTYICLTFNWQLAKWQKWKLVVDFGSWRATPREIKHAYLRAKIPRSPRQYLWNKEVLFQVIHSFLVFLGFYIRVCHVDYLSSMINKDMMIYHFFLVTKYFYCCLKIFVFCSWAQLILPERVQIVFENSCRPMLQLLSIAQSSIIGILKMNRLGLGSQANLFQFWKGIENPVSIWSRYLKSLFWDQPGCKAYGLSVL